MSNQNTRKKTIQEKLKNQGLQVLTQKNIVKKFKSFTENTPVFLQSGHGLDWCNVPPFVGPVKAIVPEGSLYISLSKCGRAISVNTEITNAFASTDPAIQEIIKKPYLPGARQKLAELFKIDEDDITIKYPGDTYIVKAYVPFAPNRSYYLPNVERNFSIWYTGLLEKNLLEKVYDKEYEFIKIPKIIIPGSNYIYLDNIPYDVFLNHDKWLNTYSYASQLLDRKSKKANKTQEDIQLISELAKRRSLEHQNFDFLKDIEKFIKPENQSSRKITTDKWSEWLSYLSLLSFKASDFLKYYEASIYPSQQLVSQALQNLNIKINDSITPELLGKIEDEIETVMGVTKPETPNGKNTNKYMLENFPGIHYSYSCRSVRPGCEEKAALRRTNSELEHQTQQKIAEVVYSENLQQEQEQEQEQEQSNASSNIVYQTDKITVVNPGTVGSIPIVFDLYTFHDIVKGDCTSGITLNSYGIINEIRSVTLPSNIQIPEHFNTMTHDEKMRTIYGKTLLDLANERIAQYKNSKTTYITIDVDPDETYVFDHRFLGILNTPIEKKQGYQKKTTLTDYIKNRNVEIPVVILDYEPILDTNRTKNYEDFYKNKTKQFQKMELKTFTIPPNWLSSCYTIKNEDRPAKPKGHSRWLVSDLLTKEYPNSLTNETSKSIQKELKNIYDNWWNYERTTDNLETNRTKWNYTKKYGGKRMKKRNNRNKRNKTHKKNKKNKRTVKK